MVGELEGVGVGGVGGGCTGGVESGVTGAGVGGGCRKRSSLGLGSRFSGGRGGLVGKFCACMYVS